MHRLPVHNLIASNLIRFLFVLLGLILIAACSPSTENSNQAQTPVTFSDEDECHLCGMAILQFPGPKGQLLTKHNQKIKKFCSTNDLFAFVLQPENRHAVEKIYVHDMSEGTWNTPSDEHLIDARNAWYVSGHKLKGAMGHTLAAFSDKAKAEFFASNMGGSLLSFEQITIETLTKMAHASH